MNQNINWRELKTGVGDAGHIPDAINKLNSQNADERDRAYWSIDNYVIIQSDLYESAYYVIEPIVEILEYPYTVDRTLPLRLLAEIALGRSDNKRIQFLDSDNLETVYDACRRKFRELRNRITLIEVRNECEEKEKHDLFTELDDSYDS